MAQTEKDMRAKKLEPRERLEAAEKKEGLILASDGGGLLRPGGTTRRWNKVLDIQERKVLSGTWPARDTIEGVLYNKSTMFGQGRLQKQIQRSPNGQQLESGDTTKSVKRSSTARVIKGDTEDPSKKEGCPELAYKRGISAIPNKIKRRCQQQVGREEAKY